MTLLVLLALILTACLTMNTTSGYQKAIYLVSRTVFILILWYAFVAPLLMRWLHQYLLKKEKTHSSELSRTLSTIPYLRHVVRLSWAQVRDQRFPSKWSNFIYNCLMYTLHAKIPGQ